MSTQIQITPETGITIGSTPISNGANDRVLFQSAGAVQQSPKFTFNGDTLKLLGKDYTASNNIIDFKNHLDTIELLKMNGLGKLKIGFDSSNVDGFVFEPQLSEFSQLAFGGLKIHSLKNTTGYFGFGVASYKFGIGNNSPQARLDVRAQGALLTDIAFRVRNSADTVDLVRFNGNGTHFFFNSTGSTNINFYQYGHGIWANGGSSFRIKNLNGSTSIEGTTSTRFITDVTDKAITFDGRQLHIGGQSLPTINGDSCIIIESGTAPTTAISDRFYIYSADITAGNAAPHFRTENGAIVKVYQETTAVAASTLVGGGGTTLTDTDTFDGYTIQQIVKALRNQGLLA